MDIYGNLKFLQDIEVETHPNNKNCWTRLLELFPGVQHIPASPALRRLRRKNHWELEASLNNIARLSQTNKPKKLLVLLILPKKALFHYHHSLSYGFVDALGKFPAFYGSYNLKMRTQEINKM